MGSLLIRNIPDDVLERLKARARAEGKSAEQFARDTIASAARPSREEIFRQLDAIRAGTKPVDLQTTLEIMEEARHERDEGPFLPDLDIVREIRRDREEH